MNAGRSKTEVNTHLGSVGATVAWAWVSDSSAKVAFNGYDTLFARARPAGEGCPGRCRATGDEAIPMNGSYPRRLQAKAVAEDKDASPGNIDSSGHWENRA